ncbi:hypothetical protein [Actinomadura sp. 7K507]|uniref:hypothetical protein n=1 Tax=Actinomadura sp. 7K507 TaxID=2530365 RepID=UPI00104BBD1B|nr:hypothetical protein [Actinomadura sp. 7K507]TDC83196.1 hypothetical protein E1285_29330 [Actinomadura sp. 7K507]
MIASAGTLVASLFSGGSLTAMDWRTLVALAVLFALSGFAAGTVFGLLGGGGVEPGQIGWVGQVIVPLLVAGRLRGGESRADGGCPAVERAGGRR